MRQAHSICPGDPLLCNELGVLAYRNHQYADAEAWLQRAQEAAPAGGSAGAAPYTLYPIHRRCAAPPAPEYSVFDFPYRRPAMCKSMYGTYILNRLLLSEPRL